MQSHNDDGQNDAIDSELLLSSQRIAPVEVTFSLRSIAAGIAIGIPICFASIYYGLQAGQNNSMPLPSALLGYAIMRPFAKYMRTPFSPMENVFTMTLAASMGGIPTTAGLCGIIPALEYLLTSDENGPLLFTLWRVILWSISVCLFGVLVAVPFREHFVLRSNLRFPTGTAMAVVIGMLHKRPDIMNRIREQQTGDTDCSDEAPIHSGFSTPWPNDPPPYQHRQPIQRSDNTEEQVYSMRVLRPITIFTFSSMLSLITYWIPDAKELPIFGIEAARKWAWSMEISPAYVGYGMIMDPLTTAHMLLGAIIGWGILSPLAKTKGWAPGPVEDWTTGSQGWTIWVSLGIILGDSLVGICWIAFQLIRSQNFERPILSRCFRFKHTQSSRPRSSPPTFASDPLIITNQLNSDTLERSPLLLRSTGSTESTIAQPGENGRLSGMALAWWFGGGTLLCILITWYLFNGLLTAWQIILSIVVIFPLGMASIRSMGETDNSLASSLGKVSQFFFALFIQCSNPNAIIAFLLVGGIAEGGSYQSSDVMEHLKTGNLVGASAKDLFYGQIIGSLSGAIVSSCVYKMFTSAGSLPSKKFPVPNAQLWLATVKLICGRGLLPGSLRFSIAGFAISTVCASIKIMTANRTWSRYIPSGIAVGIGIYILPAYTIPQALGGLTHFVSKRYFRTGELAIITTAIALVLGDTLVNILFMVLQSVGKSPP